MIWAGHRLARVGSIRGGKTDELGTGKCESGSDEDGNALESVCKRARVVPVLCADVLAIRSLAGPPPQSMMSEMNMDMTTTKSLRTRRPEFLLYVSKCPKNVDRDDRELQCRYRWSGCFED